VAGCLALLRDSPARPVVGCDELIEDLELGGPEVPMPAGPATLVGLSSLERDIAAALVDGPQTSDRLIARTGRPAGEVAAALTMLQLRGVARSHGSLLLAAGALLTSWRRDAA
jgi:predicted Rossmann fold nucleotide-binding protein DprA/Smf involved in DNA uptake